MAPVAAPHLTSRADQGCLHTNRTTKLPTQPPTASGPAPPPCPVVGDRLPWKLDKGQQARRLAAGRRTKRGDMIEHGPVSPPCRRWRSTRDKRPVRFYEPAAWTWGTPAETD